jgi:tetratricopeptide (TPR) repeat protein
MKEKKAGRQEMEKLMAELARTIQGQNPKAFAGLNKSTNEMVMGKSESKRSAEDVERQAQELMYDAWEENKKSTRIRLAKKALSIFPDCADAYNLLAVDAAKSPEESREFYEKGMAAGQRTLGEKKFKEGKGHFWGILETRPYMRSRADLMQCLWDAGAYDEAIGHARELLKLNPNDNQGIRYILIAYLAGLGRYDDLDKFMNGRGYRNDCATDWLYTRVLLSFVKNGDTEESRRELADALEMNFHVPKYLTEKKPIPRILPDSITMGGEDEAFCYADTNISAWKKAPGALDWLKAQARIKTISRGGKA